LAAAPGWPDAEVTVTPEVRPLSALSTRTGAPMASFLSSTFEMAAVTTLLRCVP